MSEEATAAGRSFFTPFNVIVSIIVIIGLYITALRFTGGLDAVTNLSDYNPWGIWIGFDLLVGVALAAGGFVTSSAVYLFGMKRYHSAVRPAILTAFLGYALVVLALIYDVGRPWRLPYPFLVQQGTTSMLFLVGACVVLSLAVLFLEFFPAALEWRKKGRLRNLITKLTLVLTIFSAILATLHEAGLGAVFLIAPSKLHPLWYSSYLPIFFFVTSVIAGLSMVIFENTLSHRYFRDKMDEAHLNEKDQVALGFGKAASWILAGYFAIQVIGIFEGNDWRFLSSSYGCWFLVELLGFVALPCFLYAVGVRNKNLPLIRCTAVLTVLGILLNRFNVCLIGFNWHLPASERYFPHPMEIGITVFLVTLGLVAFKFVVTRMPIYYKHPDYEDAY